MSFEEEIDELIAEAREKVRRDSLACMSHLLFGEPLPEGIPPWSESEEKDWRGRPILAECGCEDCAERRGRPALPVEQGTALPPATRQALTVTVRMPMWVELLEDYPEMRAESERFWGIKNADQFEARLIRYEELGRPRNASFTLTEIDP